VWVDEELVCLVAVVFEETNLVGHHILLADAALLLAQDDSLKPLFSSIRPVLLYLLARMKVAAFGRAGGADSAGDLLLPRQGL
jgi:hypothetical protein